MPSRCFNVSFQRHRCSNRLSLPGPIPAVTVVANSDFDGSIPLKAPDADESRQLQSMLPVLKALAALRRHSRRHAATAMS
jgi:hypothetical protein